MVMEGIAPLGTLDPQHAIARFATALAEPARAFAFMRGHGNPPRGMLVVFFPPMRSIPPLRHSKERPPQDGAEASDFEIELTSIESVAERRRRLRGTAIAKHALSHDSQASRSASLRAVAARSAEARMEGPNMPSRDLAPIVAGYPVARASANR